jgi:hypothetical protein
MKTIKMWSCSIQVNTGALQISEYLSDLTLTDSKTFYIIVCHADIHYFLEGYKCRKALLISILFSWVLRVTRVHGPPGDH